MRINQHQTESTFIKEVEDQLVNSKYIKKVESIAVLDQEISPAIIDYNFIRNRFVKGCLKYVSRLYLVGNEAKKAATIVLR